MRDGPSAVPKITEIHFETMTESSKIQVKEKVFFKKSQLTTVFSLPTKFQNSILGNLRLFALLIV